jgi:ERCC4 domain
VGQNSGVPEPFLIARNPDTESTLPYLLRLPIDDGVVLRSKSTWPTTARVFCYEGDDAWTSDLEIVETLEVSSCRRRGPAVDLVLARGSNNRSQFVFTQLKGGRPAVFWQTAKTAKAARPGARMPKRRASEQTGLVIVSDSRERYAYRFAEQQVEVERRSLRAGDYAVLGDDGTILAAVERKKFDNFVSGLVDGSLLFQLSELSELPRAAVVVEGRYEDLLKLKHTQPGWVMDLVARVQVRHPAVPLVFAGSRKHAEEYTYRFLGAARAELG